jgi:hypothetical protein
MICFYDQSHLIIDFKSRLTRLFHINNFTKTLTGLKLIGYFFKIPFYNFIKLYVFLPGNKKTI